MTIFTEKQIGDLNNAMVANQAVSLGTVISELRYGSITADPAHGTITPLAAVSYSIHPALGTATATKADYTLGVATTGVTAGITQPDFPRVLTIKGNAGGIAGDVKIYGTDMVDEIVSDTIALNAASEVVGVVAFKTVTSIDYPAKTNGSGDKVSIGRGDLYGFPIAIPNASTVIAKTFNGAADAGTVTVDATVGKSVFDPAGTVNGTKVLTLTFLA